jgi:single-strand DNA-binding protein
MSNGTFNRVELIGRLGNDPELRFTPNTTTVATFSLYTSRRWKGADGETKTESDRHRIVVWGRQAEACNEHLRTGSRVRVEGRIGYPTWTDGEGQTRYGVEIVAHNVLFLDTPNGNGGSEVVDDLNEVAEMIEDLPF